MVTILSSHMAMRVHVTLWHGVNGCHTMGMIPMDVTLWHDTNACHTMAQYQTLWHNTDACHILMHVTL